MSSNQTFVSHIVQRVMWAIVIQSNLHISPGLMGHVNYCHPLKPSYLTWSNGSCELLSSTQTFISHLIQWVMWTTIIQSNLHISPDPMSHVNYYHPIKPSYLPRSNGSCELLSSTQTFISHLVQWVMWTTVIHSNLHISHYSKGHVSYCHPIKPSYLIWSNGSCELLSSNQTFISHLGQWVMWAIVIQPSLHIQGSPNQAKWATSSPWFQWSRPISVKKRSFSQGVSLFKSIFCSPIIILFLQYSHKRSSHVLEMWPIQGLMFNILFQTSFLRS